MTEKVYIELNLPAGLDNNLITDLRDFFRKEIPGMEFALQEEPVKPGRMNGQPIDWANIILHASTVATVELAVHESLEIINEKLIKRIKEARDKFIKEKNIRKLYISGSARHRSVKSNFKIDEKQIHYYTDRFYSIDTQHTYVLLVGCGNFKHSDQITNIPLVKDNLSAMKDLFTDEAYFAIPKENITISEDEDIRTIEDHLDEVSKKENIETFIFYYAGHGFCPTKDSYFLAAADTKKVGNKIRGGISKDFIKNDILDQSPAKQKIAIIDACYSGIMTQGTPAELFDKTVEGSYILASSNILEQSYYDNSKKCTFFTEALIDTVHSGVSEDADVITLDDLYVGTKKILVKNKWQEPIAKSALNIDPANFIVSANPAFSMEKECGRMQSLIDNGKYEEAHIILIKIKRHINDNNRETITTLEEMLFNTLLKEADGKKSEKKYDAAIRLYNIALQIRSDAAVLEKLEHTRSLKKKTSEKRIKIIFSFIAIFTAAIVVNLLFNHKTPEETKPTEPVSVGYKSTPYYKDYLNHHQAMLAYEMKSDWPNALLERDKAWHSLDSISLYAVVEMMQLIEKQRLYTDSVNANKIVAIPRPQADNTPVKPDYNAYIEYDISTVKLDFGNGFTLTKKRDNHLYGVIRRTDGMVPAGLEFKYTTGSLWGDGCKMVDAEGNTFYFDKNAKRINK